MKTLRFALAPALALILAAPAFADAVPLKEISRYLNAMQTAEADFTQVNADGTISTGTLFIKRPGRVRFEYAPPDKTLVMAGGGQVAIFDPKSNTGPEQYPLSKTPLSLILDDKVDLERARMVTDHREDGAKTIVTAQDPEHPEYGNIQLVFTAAPTQLRQWVISDEGGSKTTVILGDLREGVELGSAMFSIQNEIIARE